VISITSGLIVETSTILAFILRDGVLFHNHPLLSGSKREVDAYDFAYSFNRIINPKTASDGAWIFNGIVAKENAFVALDDTTFQINLNYGINFGKNPIGTGPFQFANWAESIKLNLIKNEEYFESTAANPIPTLDAISISFIQSKQTELLEFTQGKLDLFTGIYTTVLKEQK